MSSGARYIKRKEVSPMDKQIERIRTSAELDIRIAQLSSSVTKIQLENFRHPIDKYLLKNILVPYL